MKWSSEKIHYRWDSVLMFLRTPLYCVYCGYLFITGKKKQHDTELFHLFFSFNYLVLDYFVVHHWSYWTIYPQSHNLYYLQCDTGIFPNAAWSTIPVVYKLCGLSLLDFLLSWLWNYSFLGQIYLTNLKSVNKSFIASMLQVLLRLLR